MLGPDTTGAELEGTANSAWGRFFGQEIDTRYRAFADPRASRQEFGGQAGLDLWRRSLMPGNRDAAGVYVAVGNIGATVNGLTTNAAATGYVLGRTGTVNLDAYSGGVYWTHYGWWYVDAVFQGTEYNGQAQTQFARLGTNGYGLLPSLEVGYPVPLPQLGPGFILELQGQILYQHVSFSQANDGLGDVALASTSGETGRLGLRGQWSIPGSHGSATCAAICGKTGAARRRRALQATRCRWTRGRRGWNLPVG